MESRLHKQTKAWLIQATRGAGRSLPLELGTKHQWTQRPAALHPPSPARGRSERAAWAQRPSGQEAWTGPGSPDTGLPSRAESFLPSLPVHLPSMPFSTAQPSHTLYGELKKEPG